MDYRMWCDYWHSVKLIWNGEVAFGLGYLLGSMCAYLDRDDARRKSRIRITTLRDV